jgi:hypothetical protein
MFSTSAPNLVALFEASGPLLAKRTKYGCNDFGIKPKNDADNFYPTRLINWGKATSREGFETLKGRPGSWKSGVSMDGMLLEPAAIRQMFSPPSDACQAEEFALRACVLQDKGPCDSEYEALQACQRSLGPLRSQLRKVSGEFRDFLAQNVDDNLMKPFKHRPYDFPEHQQQQWRAVAKRRGQGTKRWIPETRPPNIQKPGRLEGTGPRRSRLPWKM